MKISICPYELARRYIVDTKPLLGETYYEKVLGYIRARSLPPLASCTSLLADSTSYSVDQRRILMQVEAMFKKNIGLDPVVNTRRAALKTFIKAERQCADTNQRLTQWYIDAEANKPHRFNDHVKRAQAYVKRVLGPFTPFLNRLPNLVRVTSGATSTRPRKLSLPYMKMKRKIVCTHAAQPYLRALLSHYGFNDSGRFVYTTWNRVITVTKNWKTDRTIACEPEGNLPLQLAFDTYGKERLLLRAGINLSDQSRNQELARLGSISGEIATLDVETASDTTAWAVVPILFEPEWETYLTRVRSFQYKLAGSAKIRTYEKFSSMGNGTTFALETLVFASLAHAVGSKTVSVYGDDIIVDSDKAEELTDLLAFFGYTVNKGKSYHSGPFRESCGKHWMNGVDVTPLFFRTTGTSKADLCLLVNNIMHIGFPGSRTWELARDVVISAQLPFVPYTRDGPTTGVFIDTSSAYQRKLIRSHLGKNPQCPSFKAYVSKTQVARITDSRAYYLWHLTRCFKADLLSSSELEALQTSSVPLDQRKYVRKWVVYKPVDLRRTPVQLHSWSDYVLPPHG